MLAGTEVLLQIDETQYLTRALFYLDTNPEDFVVWLQTMWQRDHGYETGEWWVGKLSYSDSRLQLGSLVEKQAASGRQRWFTVDCVEKRADETSSHSRCFEFLVMTTAKDRVEISAACYALAWIPDFVALLHNTALAYRGRIDLVSCGARTPDWELSPEQDAWHNVALVDFYKEIAQINPRVIDPATLAGESMSGGEETTSKSETARDDGARAKPGQWSPEPEVKLEIWLGWLKVRGNQNQAAYCGNLKQQIDASTLRRWKRELVDLGWLDKAGNPTNKSP